jgi:hypothetical protein
MLKKLLSLFLVAMLLMSCTGCASRNAATKTNAISSDTTKSDTVSSDTATATKSDTVSSDIATATKSDTVSSDTQTRSSAVSSSTNIKSNVVSSDTTKSKAASSTIKSNTVSDENISDKMPDVKVQFGIDGKTFILKLDDNDTAAELARNIGEDGKNLPIFHFNDFENYEVMQYYDIPSRYSIPSNPEKVTSEKAGEVYYSAPNRVILFYQDAEVKGEFTKVGTLEKTDGLKAAVENNPVLEGWSNKVIIVNYKK